MRWGGHLIRLLSPGPIRRGRSGLGERFGGLFSVPLVHHCGKRGKCGDREGNELFYDVGRS